MIFFFDVLLNKVMFFPKHGFCDDIPKLVKTIEFNDKIGKWQSEFWTYVQKIRLLNCNILPNVQKKVLLTAKHLVGMDR